MLLKKRFFHFAKVRGLRFKGSAWKGDYTVSFELQIQQTSWTLFPNQITPLVLLRKPKLQFYNGPHHFLKPFAVM